MINWSNKVAFVSKGEKPLSLGQFSKILGLTPVAVLSWGQEWGEKTRDKRGCLLADEVIKEDRLVDALAILQKQVNKDGSITYPWLEDIVLEDPFEVYMRTSKWRVISEHCLSLTGQSRK